MMYQARTRHSVRRPISTMVQRFVLVSIDHMAMCVSFIGFRSFSFSDMSVQNVIGDAFRGATWVALHNGGGVGFGEVMNGKIDNDACAYQCLILCSGGFGMFLDGSSQADENIQQMLYWDVINGVSRRSWSGNRNARQTVERAMMNNEKLHVTMPNDLADACRKQLSM
jgi:urocanate hydratase